MSSTETTELPIESKYQVMPPLSAEEYAALRADIAERGVLVPVVRDQHGNLLDGHHRVQVAEELGIDYRVDTVTVQDDEQARTLARTYNLARRHLSRAQKRQLIADEITTNPDRSDREISRLLGCDHKTAGSVRRELSGEIPQPDEHREFHPYAPSPPNVGVLPDAKNSKSATTSGAHRPEPSAPPKPRTKSFYKRTDTLSYGVAADLIAAFNGYEIGLKDITSIGDDITPDQGRRWGADLSKFVGCVRKLGNLMKERANE